MQQLRAVALLLVVVMNNDRLGFAIFYLNQNIVGQHKIIFRII